MSKNIIIKKTENFYLIGVEFQRVLCNQSISLKDVVAKFSDDLINFVNKNAFERAFELLKDPESIYESMVIQTITPSECTSWTKIESNIRVNPDKPYEIWVTVE